MITWDDMKREIKKRDGQPTVDLERIEIIVHVVSTIATRRRELGISLEELAKRAEIKKSRLEIIESDVNLTKFVELVKIVQALGLKITLTSI